MEYHWKNLQATWGLVPASPVSAVNRRAISPRPSCIPKMLYPLDHHTSPKCSIPSTIIHPQNAISPRPSYIPKMLYPLDHHTSPKCYIPSTIIHPQNALSPRPSYIPKMLYPLDHHTSPKKDASSQELSNTVFSHSSNVNSHVITDAIFVMYVFKRRFFQWYSMTNIAIYIINNELRYHYSINYRLNWRAKGKELTCSAHHIWSALDWQHWQRE